MDDQQHNNFTSWITSKLDNIVQIVPLTGDCSSRRYVRIITKEQHFIAMDASLLKETCTPFVRIAQSFRAAGVNTPTIHAQNLEHGFLLLTDFGDTSLNEALTAESATALYHQCFDQLLLINQQKQLPHYPLPSFNNGIYTYYEESSWFLTWFLQQEQGRTLSHTELAKIEREIHFICAGCLLQPQTVIHRDYHSHNIMLAADNQPGILDFQDASIGPVTYDLVSLLCDCYIDWPDQNVTQWMADYHKRLVEANIIQASFKQFERWFHFSALQRHLKCAGLFVRLNLRDNKPGYLQYIPRVLNYIVKESAYFPETSFIHELACSPCEV